MLKKSSPQEAVNQLINLYNKGQLLSVVEQAKGFTELYPNIFIIWNILGMATAQTGMLDIAIEAFNKSISLKPDYAETYNNKGNVLKDQIKIESAIEAYKKAISLKPDYAEAYSNMGNALQEQGKLHGAIVAYEKAITLKPDYAEAYNNIGNVLVEQGKLDEAINVYKKSISVNADYAPAYNNLGIVLKKQYNVKEAINSYKKALRINPNYAEAYSNMGIALQDQGKLGEAIQSFNKAISLKPDLSDTHLNLSYSLLNSGKLREGFNENEWRWKTNKFITQQRHFLQPLWNRKINLKGKRILLWSEQGIGDTIMWSSCLSLVSSQAKHCILECQEKLVPLLKRSFPNVEVKAVNKSLDSERDDFDFHLPMGSLYKHFLEEIIQNTKPNAYLVPDPKRVIFWKERLKSIGQGPYIGISWKSSDLSPARMPNYASIPQFFPILKIPDVTFINLQYVDFKIDLNKIKDETGLTVHNFDDLDHYDNIDDVAALCTALDMIVSTKTTVPLISVGVGTPTKIANWRQSPWNNILHNPFGPSVDIFERNTWETWDNVFSLIAKDIFKITKNWSF
jgi:tetratricopeptide (TPR) repeat protein